MIGLSSDLTTKMHPIGLNFSPFEVFQQKKGARCSSLNPYPSQQLGALKVCLQWYCTYTYSTDIEQYGTTLSSLCVFELCRLTFLIPA